MENKYREQWEKLGAYDPYWAVLTSPNKKGGKWDINDFFDTGEKEIENVLGKLSELNVNPDRSIALDFGCGVGRLSRALAKEFINVVALDISVSMLEEARKVNHDIRNIEFIHNPFENLKIVPNKSIGFLYSNMVLQHIPRTRQVIYIREFCKVLSSDGVMVIQTPSRFNLRSLKGWAYILLGNNILNVIRRFKYGPCGVMEIHALPKEMVLETLRQEGMEIIHVEKYESDESAFDNYMYFAKKPNQENAFGN